MRQEAESGRTELSLERRLELPGLALERLIDRALLRGEADRLGLAATEEELQSALAQLAPRADGVSGCRADFATAMNREELRQRLAVDKLMTWCLSKTERPQRRDIREFYQKHRDRFRTPPLAHAWHLVKSFNELAPDESLTRAAAEHMRDRVVRGEPFATVAEEESDCPEFGGDLGYFPQGAMVEEFDAVVFAAPVGELTPVFRTRFGYHTALVRDRKPEGVRTLHEMQPEIESLLLRQAYDKRCGELISGLRKSARIEAVTE